MKTKLLGLVSALLLGACATQENTPSQASCNPRSLVCAQMSGGSGSTSGGAANSGGASTGGTDTGLGGSDPGTGGTDTTTGGTGSVDLGGTGGSFDTGGGGTTPIAAGGSAGTSALGGTTSFGGGGAGGSAAGAGGKGGTTGAGGTGGKGGTTGAGGATGGTCTAAVPARTSWVATASSFSNVCTDPTYGLCNPPAYAIDTSTSTRFSTGQPQAGGEWLQIDLGVAASVDQVTILTSNGDFGRHIQIRMSQTANDTLAPLLVEKDGVTGSMSFTFAATTARYILITQTGADAVGVTAWWSMMDINASCN